MQSQKGSGTVFQAVFVTGHSNDGTWPASVANADAHLLGEIVSDLELTGVEVLATMRLVRVLAVTGNGLKWKCACHADTTHSCMTKLTLAPRESTRVIMTQAVPVAAAAAASGVAIGAADANDQTAPSAAASSDQEYIQTRVSDIIRITCTTTTNSNTRTARIARDLQA